MKVLVTGGAGFIGSHVVDKLLARGHDVRIFDLIHSPYHTDDDVEVVLGSVTDPEILDLALESCDAIVHLAAIADVNEVIEDPAHAENVNSRGTLNLLEAARNSKIKRFVYSSTTWVYSDCNEDKVDETTLIPPPSHFYTATKLAGELYCKSYAELYGVESTILRFGIPYGPRARAAAVIPVFVNKALNGESITVAGSGQQYRRFVYVEDLAEGIVEGINGVAANKIYNLSSEETVTIMEIAQSIKGLVGDSEIIQTEARPGDFSGKEVSSELAKKELNWSASTPFSEGLKRYIEWRRKLSMSESESWATEDVDSSSS